MGIVVLDRLGMFPFESASDAGKLDCGLLGIAILEGHPTIVPHSEEPEARHFFPELA